MTPAEFERYLEERSVPVGSDIPKRGSLSAGNVTDIADLPPPVDSDNLGAMAEQFTPPGKRAPGAFAPELDEFERKSVPIGPTFEEKAEQVALGLGRGIKTGASALMPAFGGAVGGAKLGTLGGPFAPVTVPAMSALGFIGGFALGDRYSQYLDQFFPAPPRNELLPYRIGGDTTGQTLATIPLAFGMPVMSGNVVSRFLSQVGETARRRPILFTTSEVGGAGGAGLGGGIAETFDPGNPGTRFLYEVTFGFLTPSRWLSSAASDVYDNVSQRVASGALNRSQRQAADQLLKILDQFKEDPQQLIRALTTTLPTGVPSPTAAQKTGSPALIALEKSLAQQHERYSGEIRSQGEEAYKAYEALMSQLRRLGDMESLQKVADMRDQALQKHLADRLVFAHADAAEKIARISKLNPTTDARAYVGRVTQDAINGSLRDARKVESALWDEAYKSSLRTIGELSPDQLRFFRDDALEVPDMQRYRDELSRASSRLRPGDPPPDILTGRINDVWERIKTKGGTRTIYEDRRHLKPDFKQIIRKDNGKYVLQEYDLSKKNPFSGVTFPMLVRKSPQELADFLGSVPIKETPVTLQQNLYPRTVEAGNFRAELARTAAELTPTGFKYNLSPYVKGLLAEYGIDENAIDLYRQGMRTPEFLETKVVPSQFLPAIDDKPIDVFDLVQLRGELLNEARKASSGNAPDSNAARSYSSLANSILKDLSDEASGLNSDAYNTARSYSQALNNVYTRTFAGEMLSKDPRGAMRYTPETLIEAAFSIGPDLTTQRMREIEDASTFLLQEGRRIAAESKNPAVRQLLKDLIPDAKNRSDSVADAANITIRLAAANSIKQVMRPDGTIESRLDVPSLIQWAADNNTLVRKAGLAGDLDNAARAENLFSLVTRQNSKINDSLKKRTTFSKLLSDKTENPTTVVTQMIRGKNPTYELNKLVKLAKSGGPDAVDGLRATIMDYAFTQASKGGGGFSPLAFEKAFFTPLAPNKPSLYALMRSQGIMTVAHGNNIRALLNPMKQIEAAMESGQVLDEVINRLGLAGQFGARFIGAQAGSAISRMAGGAGTIQIPAYGASVAQELFDKMPSLSVRSVLEDATKDPAFMATMLDKRAVTPQQQIKLGRQMHAYLLSQGYTDADYNPPEISEVPETPTTGAPASKLLRQLPPAPPTTGMPGLSSAPSVRPQGPGPRVPAAPPMPGASGQPPTSRQMLQSLFPFDATLRAGSPLQ